MSCCGPGCSTPTEGKRQKYRRLRAEGFTRRAAKKVVTREEGSR